jgi:hypothetical protein
VSGDVSAAMMTKFKAIRTNVHLDITTALAIRRPTILASASSTSTDYTTRLRDYYADVANAS